MFKQNSYTRIFLPVPQIYQGPSGKELTHGKFYEHWVVNDHCHIQDRNGLWHMFGITHPETSLGCIHEGELQLFHAVSDNPLTSYQDLGTILPPSERPNEREEIHSPCVVLKDDVYYMIYGPLDFRMMKSCDLVHWESCGTIFSENCGGARDPQILFHNGEYILIYCWFNKVCYRNSQDLFHWGEQKILLELPEWINPESPFLYCKDNKMYLFVCLWDGVNYTDSVAGAYQYVTQVYAVNELRRFISKDFLTNLAAHAPEVIDYNGNTYLTSAFFPENGISICELELM